MMKKKKKNKKQLQKKKNKKKKEDKKEMEKQKWSLAVFWYTYCMDHVKQTDERKTQVHHMCVSLLLSVGCLGSETQNPVFNLFCKTCLNRTASWHQPAIHTLLAVQAQQPQRHVPC